MNKTVCTVSMGHKVKGGQGKSIPFAAPPIIVPVISTKGGEGKSTQAANLAGFLADAGLRTLLLDGDYA